MTAYYNEHDPYAAQWLRNLITAGHIAPGIVDERDIRDVKPEELKQYTQCHFFAGIGIWSLALRRAGWSDDKPVWTGSCPCQPFSAAGRGDGFIDERHLWPHWYHLITQCEPDRIFGEQVASKDGLGWLDLVQADLEGAGYAHGVVDLCAAGVGAPHIRQRLWFVAERMGDTRNAGLSNGEFETLERTGRREERRTTEQRSGASSRLACWTECEMCGEFNCNIHPGHHACECECEGVEWWDERGMLPYETTVADYLRWLADTENSGQSGRSGTNGQDREEIVHDSGSSRLADAECNGHDRAEGNAPEQSSDGQTDGLSIGGGEELRGTGPGPSGVGNANSEHPRRNAGTSTKTQRKDEGGAIGDRSCASGADGRPGPTNGFWRDADWLYCRDGKWRPVRSGSSPLANGAPSRVGRLRAYGNSINVEAAQAFIESYY